MARAAHDLLRLRRYFSAGPTEIRAECYSVKDLQTLGSEKAIREAGKLRSEGRAYVMQDGDVVHFLFNV